MIAIKEAKELFNTINQPSVEINRHLDIINKLVVERISDGKECLGYVIPKDTAEYIINGIKKELISIGYGAIGMDNSGHCTPLKPQQLYIFGWA